MSSYLDQLKGKPAPFEYDGVSVSLRPLTFRERQEISEWIAANRSNEGYGVELERKLVLLSLVDGNREPVSESVLNDMPADLVDAIAFEVSYRCGLNKRPDEKKAMPPSTSMTPETNSVAT